jgi:hypothetical protein
MVETMRVRADNERHLTDPSPVDGGKSGSKIAATTGRLPAWLPGVDHVSR